MKEEGLVFSTDILLALAILIVIIGVSSDLMDMNREINHENLQGYYFERIISETTEILINTPGSPSNWETLPVTDNVIPGLSTSKNPKILSYDKICKLKATPQLFNTILPSQVHANITLYPKNETIPPIMIRCEDGTPHEIFIVNRTVQCDFYKKYVILELNSKSNSCYRHSTWKCGCFKATFEETERNNYYLLADNPGISWIIDTPENKNDEENNYESPVLLNDRIRSLLSQNSTGIIWIHARGDGNVLIISIPKGSSVPLQPAYFQIQPCDFVMVAWI
ncbi:MAG TPA: hypothetical protein GXX31_01255 [Methanothermobacter sp.]|jgi:hypothetical protein|uniref:Uncharacterized protein n=1 Tax=Methanothermobacter tenebrarum TaxID=680118 RepID=A0ABM7YDT2_9EURY|nr:hypothetical protein [Methanothermobacter tenebrarum]MDI6882712.1 hypothetical protein [Methanothermobacter sp.]MDX9693623.1 hypothetical protein [Methanothermobacter sp.]BDH80210.1 hypothetical protein MTTB_15890 [Methanothermobacter tenebrarum]HHW16000.1 hypothetical protein [Methanothermobacter sp.]HOQ19671.1 hypothetical protein [Methanothermobacter sp.]